MSSKSEGEAPRRCLILNHHEIVLKGNNRKAFEGKLRSNIREMLAGAGAPEAKIVGGYGRFIVPLEEGVTGEVEGTLIATLSKAFGLSNIRPALIVTPDLGEMTKAADLLLNSDPQRGPGPGPNPRSNGGRGGKAEFRTIRVETKRIDKRFPTGSVDVNRAVGAHICTTYGVRADMSHPDVTLHIDIHSDGAYVYAGKVEGPGGLPAGVSGKVLALLSAGFDSPVASWRMMRRGCSVTFVHFHSAPFTGEESIGQVREIVRALTEYQLSSKLYLVPFAEIQQEIVAATEPRYRVLLYRRMMFRIAEALARREKAEALVTGEAVGQVASQTLRNIRMIDEASGLPVLRPLAGSDKEETMATARRIGTYDISSRPYDDCCSFLAPRSPETWADPESIRTEERKLDVDALLKRGAGAANPERFGIVRTGALASS